MVKTPKRPRDPNELARMIVDLATGDAADPAPVETPAAELGRLGGLKGGKARAAALTDEQRADIARKAATARWKKLD
jgi:hypothetical protein